jgi:iron complex outermembrane recepter protein
MLKYFITSTFILIAQLVIAQETPGQDTIAGMKEVILTYLANKNTPVTFQNIYSKEIKAKSTGQEPSFLLAETPSVTVYSDAGNGQGYAYFRMRGIDQTRINITMDGVPLNEPEDQGAYFSNYPDILNSAGKIQIQRGAGTSKNGVASYGGSVELFSPDLSDSAKTSIGLNYGSFKTLRIFGEYNSGIKKGKALYIRASQISSDGYKYNSSNNSQSVFVSSALFRNRSTWKINLLAGHQQNQLAWLGVTDSLISIDRKTNANSNERDRFTQCLVQLQHKWFASRSSFVQSGVYYTYLKGNYDFNMDGFLDLPTINELYNYAFQSNLAGFFSSYTILKKQLQWTTGFHGNIYNRQHTGSEKTLGRLYQNTGYKKEASVFSKLSYRIKKVVFFADVQYRHSSFDYKGSVPLDKMNWDFFNPRAGVSVEAKPGLLFYYSLAKTGREPTRNDMFGGNDDLLADSTGIAMISIKQPESVVDQELGIRYQNKTVRLEANAYYMNFKNEIVLNGKFGPNGLALTGKTDKSFRTGIECNLAWNFCRNFTAINNSSFNYSRIQEQGEKFTPILTPSVIINQELVYAAPHFSIALSGRYQHRSFIDFANTAFVKSYFLINSRIEYNTGHFDFTLFVNNITNSKYFNNGYVDYDGSRKYFVQAPANYSAAVKYKF